jgi:di/tricarboxylate transporter
MRVGKKALISKEIGLIEAVVATDSPMLGETARSLSLAQRYDMNLIAVARRGEVLAERLSEIAFTSAALGMVLAGVLTIHEAYESIDWPIIFLLGALIPVGAALESTGGAERRSQPPSFRL